MVMSRYFLNLKDLERANEEYPEDALRFKYNSLRNYLDDLAINGKARKISSASREKTSFFDRELWNLFCEDVGLRLNCPKSGTAVKTFIKYELDGCSALLDFWEMIPLRISKNGILERFPVRISLNVSDNHILSVDSFRTDKMLADILNKSKRDYYKFLRSEDLAGV